MRSLRLTIDDKYQVSFIVKFSQALSAIYLSSYASHQATVQVPSGENLLELGQAAPMDQPIRSQGLATVQMKWPAPKIGHPSSCFLHHQHSCRRVPRIQIEFPESVKASAGHRAQIQRRRSGPPHPMRTQRDLMIEIDIGIFVPFVAGKSCGQQGLRQIRDLRNMDPLLIQVSPLPCSAANISSRVGS